MNDVLARFGRIDVLFNNVGIQPVASQKPIHLLEEEQWDQVRDFTLDA